MGMKNFLFKYRKISIWEVSYISWAMLAFHHHLNFEGFLIIAVGYIIGTFGEVEVNS